MNFPIYKYSPLRDLINSKGKKQARITRLKLCESIAIHENTLSNWLNIKSDSDQIIKDSMLELIAEFFKTEAKNLKSETFIAPCNSVFISTSNAQKINS